jgi:ubiquitin-protein ligase
MQFIFLTKLYHCNVGPSGEICLGLLKPDNWKPSVKMTEALVEIRELLYHPNPDDPLNTEAADFYRTDLKKYEKTVQEWTKKYAMGG